MVDTIQSTQMGSAVLIHSFSALKHEVNVAIAFLRTIKLTRVKFGHRLQLRLFECSINILCASVLVKYFVRVI
jgi:hypothetical protein